MSASRTERVLDEVRMSSAPHEEVFPLIGHALTAIAQATAAAADGTGEGS